VTFADLAALRAYAAERPKPLSDGPGTLAVALEAERHGMAHVEFVGGRAYWIAGPVRFPLSSRLDPRTAERLP